MSNTQEFVVVNVIGGIAVLCSYVLGLLLYPGVRESLWGGVTGDWRPIFTISMLFSAIGYLAFCYFVGFKSNGESSPLVENSALSILCALFLIASTVWMPSTIAYINTNQVLWWNLVVGSLWVTALSLVGLVFLVIGAKVEAPTLHKYLTIAGVTYIAFHCLILDAVIWAVKFPRLH
ncbi:MAG: hypothetical protein QF704_14825 [Anaerolineales bacterium]|nr:hypothetical protein [Anaerolineales bacterium]